MRFTLEEQYGAYGSHSPVLKALPHIFRIESILEYGIGEASTSIFLNYYPNLLTLTSFEHNLDFKINIKDDNRWNLIYTDWNEFIPKSKDMYVDLILVDSGPTMDERRVVLSGVQNLGKIIVLHDYAYASYKFYFNNYKYKYIYHKGQTIVLSNEFDLSELEKYVY